MSKYDQLNEERIIDVQKSCYFQNNPQFDIKTPFPSLVHENKPQGPNAFLEIHPPDTKEVYDQRFNMHYFKNDFNKENMIYISRSYCGGFWIKEFNPIMSHFFLSQEEFEKVVKKVEKLVWNFIWIKIFYVLFFIMMGVSVILIIVGGTNNNSDPAQLSAGAYDLFDFFNEVSNILIALGLILIIVALTFLTLTVFCTLKRYEFMISKYFLKINQKKFLFRNIYWKVGAFCKFIQIQILPFTPQQFWLMQSQASLQHDHKEKKTKEEK